ncbi:MAG: hypothetical protein L3K19_09700 [Thermoplasmata archaeon]|nr:hypothetical protein [Thermoplasmata archaeon]
MTGVRDPQASWPFNPNPGGELDAVFRACDADESPWLGKTARFLAYQGAHISVLTGGWRRRTRPNGAVEEWYEEPLNGHAVRGDLVYWRRPKNQKPIGMPIKREIRGWVKEWLDEPRPYSEPRYLQVMGRAGDRCGLHINPLRFRHTCGVLLYHVHRQPLHAIRRWLGCTPEVLDTYIANPPFQINQELVASGW